MLSQHMLGQWVQKNHYGHCLMISLHHNTCTERTTCTLLGSASQALYMSSTYADERPFNNGSV
jgi:hypothetical protein